MQIVIDIPDYTYEELRDCKGCITIGEAIVITQAIKNGTPLPKGHGKIIDESKITSIYYHEEEVKEGAITAKGIVIDGTDAPTIIEADKLPNNELENPFNDSRFGG